METVNFDEKWELPEWEICPGNILDEWPELDDSAWPELDDSPWPELDDSPWPTSDVNLEWDVPEW